MGTFMLPTTTNARLREVLARCGLSRSTLYRQMGEGAFPRPLRVGVRAVRWREAEIEDWLASRPRATLP